MIDQCCIVQLRYTAGDVTQVGPAVAVVTSAAEMRVIREAFAHGTQWRGGVIIRFVEDPLGVTQMSR